MTEESFTNQIEKLWAKKCEILSEVWNLVLRQKERVAAGDIDGLLDVLAYKQRLLAHLQELDGKMRTLVGDDWKEKLTDHSGKTNLMDLVEKSRQILRKIIQAERECESELLRRRDAVAAELAQLRSAAEARAAYFPDSSPTGGGLDLSL